MVKIEKIKREKNRIQASSGQALLRYKATDGQALLRRKASAGQALLRYKATDGQVMFLTVVVLGAIIASVTTIAGLLMSYQIKRSADIASSQKAIFAADAGVECMMYQLFNKQADGGVEAKKACEDDNKLSNDAYFEISVTPVGGGFPTSFISTGYYGSSVRSMQIELIRV